MTAREEATRKQFFSIGEHRQRLELSKGKIIKVSCTCRWATIHPDAWDEGKTLCHHLRKAIMGSNKRIKMVDWKRNNKVVIRNAKEAVDFHDVVKLLLVRMLRRKHPDSSKVPIYTEHNPEDPNESYPDIWMRDQHGDIYVWELQEAINSTWKKRINKQYEDVTLFIVPLEKLPHRSLRVLKHVLKEYVI